MISGREALWMVMTGSGSTVATVLVDVLATVSAVVVGVSCAVVEVEF